MEENQSEVGSWDQYIKNFLKADDVTSVEDEYVCIAVEEADYDGEKSVRLHLERSPNKYLFDLNKTNAVFVKNANIKHPKDLIGKKLRFDKVKAFSPKAKTEVDSLRINKNE